MSASSVTVSVFEYPKLARKRETGRNHTFVGVMDEPNEFRGLLFSLFKQHCHDGLTRSNSDPSSIDWGACPPFQVVRVGKKLCSAELAAFGRALSAAICQFPLPSQGLILSASGFCSTHIYFGVSWQAGPKVLPPILYFNKLNLKQSTLILDKLTTYLIEVKIYYYYLNKKRTYCDFYLFSVYYIPL